MSAGRTYTLEERKAIVRDARDTAAKLLEKLEELAHLEGVGVHEISFEGTRVDDTTNAPD